MQEHSVKDCFRSAWVTGTTVRVKSTGIFLNVPTVTSEIGLTARERRNLGRVLGVEEVNVKIIHVTATADVLERGALA